MQHPGRPEASLVPDADALPDPREQEVQMLLEPYMHRAMLDGMPVTAYTLEHVVGRKANLWVVHAVVNGQAVQFEEDPISRKSYFELILNNPQPKVGPRSQRIVMSYGSASVRDGLVVAGESLRIAHHDLLHAQGHGVDKQIIAVRPDGSRLLYADRAVHGLFIACEGVTLQLPHDDGSVREIAGIVTFP